MHKPTLDQLVEQEIESYLDEIAPKHPPVHSSVMTATMASDSPPWNITCTTHLH